MVHFTSVRYAGDSILYAGNSAGKKLINSRSVILFSKMPLICSEKLTHGLELSFIIFQEFYQRGTLDKINALCIGRLMIQK